MNASRLSPADSAPMAAKLGVAAERCWIEEGYIALSDIGDVFDFTGGVIRLKPGCEISEGARRAIKRIKVKTKRSTEGKGDDAHEVTLTEVEVTLWDKPAALVLRLKALGELDPTIEYTGKDGGAIQQTLSLLDINTDEFKALPIEERIRQLREAVMATELPAERLIP